MDTNNGPVSASSPELTIGGKIDTRDFIVILAAIGFFLFARSKGWF
jgi:hypothetical protein